MKRSHLLSTGRLVALNSHEPFLFRKGPLTIVAKETKVRFRYKDDFSFVDRISWFEARQTEGVKYVCTFSDDVRTVVAKFFSEPDGAHVFNIQSFFFGSGVFSFRECNLSQKYITPCEGEEQV